MKGWHPTQELLVEYAAGTLPKAQGICIAVHMHYCTDCQVTLEKLKVVGAQIWEEGPPVKVTDNCKSAVMSVLDSIEQESKENLVTAVPSEASETIPKPLWKWIPSGFDALNWHLYLPILSVAHLTENEGYQLALHKIKAGGKVVSHTHRGDEITVVLKGCFSDQYGHYKEGDFVHRDGSHSHAPMASQDGDCICLTVLKEPVKLTSWWGRVLNPLLN